MSKKPANPFVGDPDATVVGLGKAGPKQRSEDTGRFLPCLGNSLVAAHPRIFLPVQQGPAILHALCPVGTCRMRYLMQGPGWKNVGVTRSEAMKIDPSAIFG